MRRTKTSRFTGEAFASAALTLLALCLAGCPGSGGGGGGPDIDPDPERDPCAPRTFTSPEPCENPPDDALTPAQKLRADQIISVFENDTIELQYAYIENIDDGRGYTAGRAGFTSATGDLVVVVERYVAEVPDSDLAPFLPRLRELADQESDSVEGLEGLPEAWAAAAEDERFRAAQDGVVDDEYFRPAIARWCGLGLTAPLSLAALYDTIIQHGEGEDPDGLPAILDRTVDTAGGSPADGGVDESEWLSDFLDERQKTLEFACNEATREGWADSLDRVEAFREIAATGNVDLEGPIEINTPDHQATIP